MGVLSPIADVSGKAPSIEFITPTKAQVLEAPATPQPEKKKKSRRRFEFTLETLQAYSHYRQDHAAILLGVSAITLKRNCNRLKYRWPYRTIKAQARRAAKLEAQRLQRQAEFSARRAMTPPPSPSMLAPELLLHLREGHKSKSFNASPTSVSSPIYPSPAPMAPSPKAQFPLRGESTQLPPLSQLLAKHRSHAMNVTPASFNANRPKRPSYPHHHHHLDDYRGVNYKSPIYAASYELNAPRFPIGRLPALAPIVNREADRRGF